MSRHVTPKDTPIHLPVLPLAPGQAEQVKGGLWARTVPAVQDIHMNQGNGWE